MRRLVHLLSGLEIGGKERIALKLAHFGRRLGLAHDLVLFDRPFRGVAEDFDPGDVPWTLLRRGPGLDLRFVRELGALLAHECVDVVHAHNDSALVYAVLAARRVRPRKPRVIATFHTRPSHPTLWAGLACRLAATRAAAVTAVSPDLAQHYLDRGWLGRCEVLWSGVETERFRPGAPADGLRERLRIPDGSLLVGHVGRFHPVKRQEDLLAAGKLLRERGVRASLVFVGLGPGRAAFADPVRGDPGVHVIPRVLDMPAFYRALDLFVLCSTEEAAPMVLLEAMASGLPSVVTDAGSMAAMVGAEGAQACGLVVPRRRPDLLADAIGTLADDAALRRELGARARRRAVAAFSEEREWADYVRLYTGRGAGSAAVP